MPRKKKNSDLDQFQVVLNRLKDAKEIVYDCETTGLDWKKCATVGHVITFSPNPVDSYYLPVRHGGGGNIDGAAGPTTPTNWDGQLHRIEPDLLKALDRQDLKITGHNVGFDLKFLFRLGFKFNAQCEDTIVNAPLIDEWVGKYSLEACAARAGVQAKKSAEIVAYLCSKFSEAAANPKQAMGHFWRLAGDDPMAVEYARGDGTTTWQLRDAQMLEIEKQGLTKVHGIESRLIRVLARMTTRGIKIDEERFSKLRAHIKGLIGDDREPGTLRQKFPDNFNVRSPEDVKFWMEKHGHTDWPLTPKKQVPSFPESWLENYEAGRQIVEVRKMTTLRDTFVLPLMTTHMHNGRVHTNFNQLRGDEYGTITGRLSSDSPNMQAVPKRNVETGRLFRNIFVPDQGLWGEVDYSQAEPRLLAFYSRSRVLMDGYCSNPPVDSHLAVAKAIAAARGIEWDGLDKAEQKDRREMGKRINQTLITGGGKGVLVSRYKIPSDQIDDIWNDYFRAMPEIRVLQKRASHRMQVNGYVMSLLGRRARLFDRDKSYVALNRLLQGGNADLLKAKIVEVDDYLESESRPIDMVLNCHDATSFQFDEEHRPVYNKCLEIMQSFGPDDLISLDVPMLVDAGEGATWAEATYGPEK